MGRGSEILLIALLAGAWLFQIWLSNGQMRRYHKRTQEVRRLGTYMATGVSGNMYRRKVYATLVTDEHGKVVAAEVLSGFTVFAGSRSVPQVVGLMISDVGTGSPPEGISEKTWKALEHAAGFIRPKVAKNSLEGTSGSPDQEESA